MQAGVLNQTGQYEESTLHAGDVGFAPVTSGHYFKNIGDTDCFVVLIFNAGKFTNIDVTALVGNVPAEVSHNKITSQGCPCPTSSWPCAGVGCLCMLSWLKPLPATCVPGS